MKKILIGILLFAFIAPGTVLAGDQTPDAVFAKVVKRYILNADGSTRFEYAHRLKLLTYQAVSRYLGETFIVYNPRFQKLLVDQSTTLTADGRKIPSPANAFNDVLPAAANNAPEYAYLIERVISHTGLERNCEITLEYHIESAADFQPWLWGEELLAGNFPVDEMEIQVVVPEKTMLNFDLLNADFQPMILHESGRTIYSWTRRNCPALLPEDRHGEFAAYTPRLVFSTCPDWSSLSRFLADGLIPRIQLDDKWAQPILGRVDGLDLLSRSMEVRNTVADEIGFAPIDPAWLGYRYDSAFQVVKRNYGTEFEKAILDVALMRKMGFSADPLLVSRCQQFSEKVPALCQFTHAAVLLQAPDRDSYLLQVNGDQNRQCEDEWSGLYALPVNGADEKPFRIHPKGEDRFGINGRLQVDGQSVLKGRVILTAGGYFSPFYELSSSEGQMSFARSAIGQFLSGAEVTQVAVEKLGRGEVILDATVSVNDWAGKSLDNGWRECAPIKSAFDDWHYSPYLLARTTPVSFPARFNEEVQLEITAPDSFVWRPVEGYQKPPGTDGRMQMLNNAGRISQSMAIEKNRLTFHRQIALNARTISGQDYVSLREILKPLQDPALRVLYLDKAP